MDFGYKQLYIDGKLCDAEGGRKRDIFCPGTEEKIAELAWATKADAEAALKSAQKGFAEWSKLSLAERTKWMLILREAVIAREDELQSAVMYEMGKPYDAAKEDTDTVINALQWYPEEMKHMREEILADEENTHHHQMIRQPAGVAVAYLAWNFPLLNVGFKLGPALAAGCSLILRPSSSSPLSAYVLGDICASVDFPAGVVNVICGPSSETAATMSASPIPRVLTMIGSSETGRKVIAEGATTIKRMSMELGGNAPVLVFDDADVELAAQHVAALKFGNCGQICVAPNRVFVHKNVMAKFEALVLEHAANVKIGFGKDSGATMGPMIDPRARERVDGMVQDDVAAGAELLCGGKIPATPEKGHFYEPTILKNVTPEMRVFREEIFGPVMPLIEFEDEDAVVDLANDTEYGLSSYLYTKDAARIDRISKQLEFGEVHINGFKYAIYLPHGGIKESGIGHDCSHLALEDYLVHKRVTTTL
jgi:succinate-semialdehyde dehydrogenase / glutarate-semialdehyde dehydrogenase